MAPSKGQTASVRSAKAKLLVRFRTTPTRYGPRNPPRFPIELIKAIPAAAPVPVRKSDDIAQNGPIVPQIPAAANESAASSPRGAFKNAAATRPAAPAKAEPATCQTGSPRGSDLLPMMTMANDAARYGIALTNPTSKSLIPENDCTICGSHRLMP